MQIRAAGHEFEFICVALEGWWRVKELDGGIVGDAPSTCFKVATTGEPAETFDEPAWESADVFGDPARGGV
jgi:hypothetical protein